MEILLVGSLWFWILISLFTIIMFGLVNNDDGGWATLCIVATICLLEAFSDVHIFRFISHNPWSLILGFVGYFVIGTMWGICKWFFYVRHCRELYDEVKLEFFEKNNVTLKITDPVPDELKTKWVDHIRFIKRDIDYAPKIKDHKMRLYVWIVYWFWSMIWTIINDPIKKIFKNIYKKIAKFLQSISDKYFDDTKNDF